MRILWTDRKEIRKMNKRVTFSVLAALLFMFCVNFRTVSAADSTVIYLGLCLLADDGIECQTCQRHDYGPSGTREK